MAKSMSQINSRKRQRIHDRLRGKTAERGYGGAWRKTRAYMLSQYPICQAEGCNEPANEVDHIKPKAQGGSDHEDNLQCLCKSCHSRKTMREDGGRLPGQC